MVQQEDETHFVMKHKTDSESESFGIELVQNEEGKWVFKGLPSNMEAHLLGFD